MIRKFLSLTTVCCLFVVLSAETHAEWTYHHTKPKNEETDDAMVRFVAVRTPPSKDAQLDRNARLTISDGKSTIIEMSVNPTKNDKGDLIYEFKIAKKYLPSTRLEVFEKDKDKKEVIGGGDIYGYSTSQPYLSESK
ncbi:hypothetical protein SH528x_003551 [Novipirellula sp. SH528]|uniref:hypothetical protein n=1 Tax=Novipirellula sp. SH528 TaxID=3454466 RepID=UPI003FA00CC7